MNYNFTRGDSVNFAFKIKNGSEYVSGDDCTEVEFHVNKKGRLHSFRKLKSLNQITYDDTNQLFIVPLTQYDTFRCNPGANNVQIRVTIGNTKATLIGTIFVGEALSEDVLDEGSNNASSLLLYGSKDSINNKIIDNLDNTKNLIDHSDHLNANVKEKLTYLCNRINDILIKGEF